MKEKSDAGTIFCNDDSMFFPRSWCHYWCAFIGSIGAFASGEPPLTSIARIAKSLRIWAIVAAIGGTFDVISNFERGIMQGSTIDIVKQILIIVTAMGGVQVALLVIEWFTQEELN